MSTDWGGLYDRDPAAFQREVEKLRDRAILPPPTYRDQRTFDGTVKLASGSAASRHRVSIDAEFLLELLVMVEQQMAADGRPPLGPGPYDRA